MLVDKGSVDLQDAETSESDEKSRLTFREIISSHWQSNDIFIEEWGMVDSSSIATGSLNYEEFLLQVQSMSALFEIFKLKGKYVGVTGNFNMFSITAVHAVLTYGAIYIPFDISKPFIPLKQLDAIISLQSLQADLDEFVDYSLSDAFLSFHNKYGCHFFVSAKQSNQTVDTQLILSADFPMHYCMTTSGTTSSRPKLVCVQQQCLCANVYDLVQRFGEIVATEPVGQAISPAVIMTSPLTFDASLVLIYFALASRRRVVFVHNGLLGVENAAELLIAARVDFLQCTPSVFFSMSNACRMRLLSIKAFNIVLGGEPFPCQLLSSKLKDYVNASVYSIYGLTEISSWSSIQCLLGGEAQVDSCFCNCSAPNELFTPLGRAMFATKMSLVNVDPETNIGEIEMSRTVGGYRIMHWPYELPKLTETSMSTNYNQLYRTGDFAKLGECGECFWFCGRKDRVVKRNGVRIFLDQLETMVMHLLMEITNIIVPTSCKCVFLPHQCLLLFLTLECKSETTHRICKLSRTLKRHILSEMVSRGFSSWLPNSISLSYSIPKTNANGKLVPTVISISKEELSDSITIQDLISVLLGKSQENKILPIPASKTFIELGGNSLNGLWLIQTLVMIFPQLEHVRTRLLAVLFSKSLQCFIYEASSACCTSMRNDTDMNPLHQGQKRQLTLFQNAYTRDIFNILSRGSSKIVFPLEYLRFSVQFELLWSHKLGKCVDGSAIIVDNSVYLGSHAGRLAKMSLDDGRSEWTSKSSGQTFGRIEGTTAYYKANGFSLLIVGTLKGTVHAFHATDGNEVWVHCTNGQIKAAPLCLPQLCLVIVGSHGKSITALKLSDTDPTYSSILWCLDKNQGVAPVVAPILPFYAELETEKQRSSRNNSISKSLIDVIVLTLGGQVHRICALTGELKNTAKNFGPIFGGAVILPAYEHSLFYNSCVCFASADGGIHCLAVDELLTENKITNGELKTLWSAQRDTSFFADVVCLSDNCTIIACGRNGVIYGISAASVSSRIDVPGRQLFQIDTSFSALINTPSVHQFDGLCPFDLAFCTRSDGKLLAVALPLIKDDLGKSQSIHAGRVLSETCLSQECFSSPVVASRRNDSEFLVVMGCRDDSVHCFSIELGNKQTL